MALQKDDGSCAPWLCHYCNALCMDCSAFQAHCLLHLRRPKVRGWVPSREYIWETASSTVEKMQSDSITLGLMWHIGKVLQLLFESYWRDIEPVFYEWLERYWNVISKLFERYWRVIWELFKSCWRVIWEILESYLKVIGEILEAYLRVIWELFGSD